MRSSLEKTGRRLTTVGHLTVDVTRQVLFVAGGSSSSVGTGDDHETDGTCAYQARNRLQATSLLHYCLFLLPLACFHSGVCCELDKQNDKKGVGIRVGGHECSYARCGSVEWSESWTKCSREGKQSRRYRVLVYPTRIGKQCPAPETRACVYPGAQTILVDGNEGLWRTRQCQPTRRLLAYTGLPILSLSLPVPLFL